MGKVHLSNKIDVKKWVKNQQNRPNKKKLIIPSPGK
jgi:hypothetical protein